MEEIYNLVKYGGGGFSFIDVWHMPVFMRRYFIDMIINDNEKQKAANQAAANKNK